MHDKLDTMVEASSASSALRSKDVEAQGGIFLWLKLPDRVD